MATLSSILISSIPTALNVTSTTGGTAYYVTGVSALGAPYVPYANTNAFMFNGSNVGIGTNSPAFTHGSGLQVNAATVATVRVQYNSGYATELFADSTGTNLWQLSAAALTLGTNNTERLRIDSSGNVGIGTTSPKQKAHLYDGSMLIHGSSTGSSVLNNSTYGIIIAPKPQRIGTVGEYYPGIAFNHLYSYSGTTYDTGAQAWIGTRLLDTAGSELDALVFATKSTTNVGDLPVERMCIDSNGKVGIGTSSPQYTLHVAGDTLIGKRSVVATTTDTNVTTTKTVDLSLGNYFVYTMTGSTTLTFNNAVASGNAHSFTIVLKQDATGSRVPSWAANVKFAGGSAPPYTSTASAVDVWTFTTYDGGSTYIGSLSVKDAK